MTETGGKQFSIGVKNKLRKDRFFWDIIKNLNGRSRKVQKILYYDYLIPGSLELLSCFRTYVPFFRPLLFSEVTCPVCSKSYLPHKGNISEKGSFICPSCGIKDKVINSIRKLPGDQLLPTTPYAIEGYCHECAGDGGFEETDLLGNSKNRKHEVTHICNIKDNNGKFFKKITPSDLKRYQDAEKRWEREKGNLSVQKDQSGPDYIL